MIKLSDILQETSVTTDPARLVKSIVGVNDELSHIIALMGKNNYGGVNVDPVQIKLLRNKLMQLDRMLVQLSKYRDNRTVSWNI